MQRAHVNSGWTSAADGTLEERVYYCQNWRADVSVVLSSGGLVKEWIKYSAYGVPYSITPGDFDTDGFLTGNDSDEFDAAYNGGAGAWDARVDLNLDGSLTSADVTIFTDEFNNGEAAGYGVLSRSMVANRIGYAGYQHAPELAGTKWHVRHRVLDSETGRWTRRDPLGYVDGPNLFEYATSRPHCTTDPFGTLCSCTLLLRNTSDVIKGTESVRLVSGSCSPDELGTLFSRALDRALLDVENQVESLFARPCICAGECRPVGQPYERGTFINATSGLTCNSHCCIILTLTSTSEAELQNGICARPSTIAVLGGY